MLVEHPQILKFEMNDSQIQFGSMIYKSRASIAHCANKKENVVKSLKWKTPEHLFLNEILAYEHIQRNGNHNNVCEFVGFIMHDAESRYMASIVTKCYLFDLHHYTKGVYKKQARFIEFDNKKFLLLAKDIVQGIDFLIESKLIHRDLKPANIFLQLKDNRLTATVGHFAWATPLDYKHKSQKKCFGIGTVRFSVFLVLLHD